MAGKKSKKFRVATEGATVDGRVIERDHILQMAKNYDPAKYQATVNMEHIKGIYPGGPFGNYGLVNGLSTADNAEGKAELFAEIQPTDDLVAMNAKLQKVFTSIEINPKFAGTNEAYLVGLAVTDNPASLGTELLAFCAQNPDASPLAARKQHKDNHFTVATETVIEFVDAEPEAPSFIEKFRAIFAKKASTDEARFTTLEQALTEVAEHGQAQSTQTARQFQQVEESATATAASVTQLTARLEALEGQFNTTAAPTNPRPQAVGNGEKLTDC
jgi:Phage capsid scaffolding protein (GPO) serine peptidase.